MVPNTQLSILSIRRKQRFKLPIPYWVFLNGQPIGIMKGEVHLQIPEGEYELSIQLILAFFKWRLQFGGSRKIALSPGQHLHIQITDRERWWNLLFDIDLAIWLAKLFFTLPTPWNIVYEIISNGFFIVWAARLWIIRKHYFNLSISPENGA